MITEPHVTSVAHSDQIGRVVISPVMVNVMDNQLALALSAFAPTPPTPMPVALPNQGAQFTCESYVARSGDAPTPCRVIGTGYITTPGTRHDIGIPVWGPMFDHVVQPYGRMVRTPVLQAACHCPPRDLPRRQLRSETRAAPSRKGSPLIPRVLARKESCRATGLIMPVSKPRRSVFLCERRDQRTATTFTEDLGHTCDFGQARLGNSHTPSISPATQGVK